MKGLRLTLVLLALVPTPSVAQEEPPDGWPPSPTPLAGLPSPAGAGLLPLPNGNPSGRTYGELGSEIGRFLVEEAAPARHRLLWQRAARRPSPPYRAADGALDAGYVPGTNVLFLPPAPWGGDVGPIVAAVYLGLAYLSEREWGTARRCEERLDGRSAALSTWWESSRGPDGERAPADVAGEAEQRIAEIRALPECRGQFRLPARPPLRIPGPLP